jgi:hypothetical protein
MLFCVEVRLKVRVSALPVRKQSISLKRGVGAAAEDVLRREKRSGRMRVRQLFGSVCGEVRGLGN